MFLLHKFLQINPLLLISTTILFYILRMVGPYVNYIFIPILFFNILHTGLYLYKYCNSFNYIIFLKSNFYFILISGLFLWGFIISSIFIFSAFKELLNVFIFLFLCIDFFIFIDTVECFNKFKEVLSKQIIILASIIGILGLLKFYFQLKRYNLSFLNLPDNIIGTSLTTDNNFFILFSIIGIISIISGIEEFKNKTIFLNIKVLSLMLFILSLNILFSNSRRGFLLLLLLIIICVIYIYVRHKKRNNLFFVISIWIGSFMLFLFFLLGFMFMTQAQTKRNTLKFIGIPVDYYKFVSSTMLFKYSTIFYNPEYNDLFKIVWTEKYDHRNPESGWGTGISTLINPLTGENVDIVPVNSIGYKMDSTCIASTWSNNAYSYTDISLLFQGDSIELYKNYCASVYCFVSKDFNGEWAHISVEGRVQGITSHEYDFNKKGTWQKLQIDFNVNSGIPHVYLYWSKYEETNFKNLKGYVIFAYPEYYEKSIKTK